MRKMGISGLVLLCLLAAAPVMAVEGADAGSWWDGVVGWMAGIAKLVSQDMGPGVEPDGVEISSNAAVSSQEDKVGSMEPIGIRQGEDDGALNGLDSSESETGGTVEPNG
jgi:hypothetical protein